MSLTAKQEKFCQEYLSHGNKSEAYRLAYDAENMSEEAVHVEAQKVFNYPKVSLRITELEEEQRNTFNHTLQDSLRLDFELIEKYRACLEVLENSEAETKEIEVAKRTMAHIGVKAYNGAMDRIAKKMGFFGKHNEQKHLPKPAPKHFHDFGKDQH